MEQRMDQCFRGVNTVVEKLVRLFLLQMTLTKPVKTCFKTLAT